MGVDKETLLAAASGAGTSYASWDIRHPSKRFRHIDVPKSGLRKLQRRLLKKVLYRIPLIPQIYGSVPGRTTEDNARAHLRARVIAKLDLSDCFRRITHEQVEAAFAAHSDWDAEAIRVLTRLVTYNGYVPQGAPTSSAVANIALMAMYFEIVQRCAPRGVACSFWVDDIAMSGAVAPSLLEGVIRSIQRHGHSVNGWKTAVQRRGRDPMEITGLVVGDHVTIKPEYADAVCSRIHEVAASGTMTRTEALSLEGKVQRIERYLPTAGRSIRRLLVHVLGNSRRVPGGARSLERVACHGEQHCRRPRRRFRGH